ncbi:MAG TPA: transketolase, partial [Desulfobacterales bacterium]|nr:transketolase [Desulfobacterales bacterium]
ALKSKGPVALALTRQSVPTLDRTQYAPAQGLERGAYLLKQWGEGVPELIIIGTGSEVHLALEAAQILADKGIKVRVVSMPSWELFDRQTEEYKDEVIPRSAAKIAIEAGATYGWHKYIGGEGKIIGIDRFGASAPYKTLYERFGITSARIVDEAVSLIGAQ